jgi:ABC-type transporter MlaC component
VEGIAQKSLKRYLKTNKQEQKTEFHKRFHRDQQEFTEYWGWVLTYKHRAKN